ncbi:MAG: PucR family transcriptional regulator ligand-binding domain-containing protein [Thermoleophilia bacterium]|nr:PucR family transcriptional regulator ligand-binding domain-containing protein [Thermoleophilia bacterium]
MGLTVREAMTMWPVNQAQLLAGAKGLENMISWVHVVEVFDEPYFPAPNILLCTTGYGLRDNEDLQRRVITTSRDVGVAAILLKTGYELKQVPDNLIALADEFDVPLLRFPQQFPFSDVSRSLAGGLLEKDVEIMRDGQTLFRQMLEAKLGGRGFQEVTRILGQTLAATAFIANRRGEVLAVHLQHEPTRDEPEPGKSRPVSVIAHMRNYTQRLGKAAGLERLFALNKIVAIPSTQSAPNLFVAPIMFEHRLQGVVGMLRDGRMSDLDLWALECTAAVASLEYFALRVEEGTEQRLVGNLLDTLAVSPGDPLTFHRLATWGYDLNVPCRVVLADIAPDGGARAPRTLQHLRPLIERYCRADAYTPLVSFNDRRIIVLKQSEPSASLAREREDLHDLQLRLASGLRSAVVWVAAGRPCPPSTGLAGSFDEARRALTVVRRAQADGGALLADDLGLDNLLLDVSESSRAREYAQEILAPLLKHDSARQGGRLRLTLETFLAEDCDTQRTADRLYLHPNTVRYRVKTIEELTGRSLHSTGNRTAFSVALRVLNLAGPVQPGSLAGEQRSS